MDEALPENVRIVSSLTRELRVISELPGKRTWVNPIAGRDKKAAQLTSSRILEVLEPLADQLNPAHPPLEEPTVLAAASNVDLEPQLRVLRWHLDPDEILQGVGIPTRLTPRATAKLLGKNPLPWISGGHVGALGTAAAIKADRGNWSEEIDDARANTLVAITDRRIILCDLETLRREGRIEYEIPLDHVRYVRAELLEAEGDHSRIDLITRDENIQWFFQKNTDNAQIGAFAAFLAEEMRIPAVERDVLLSLGVAAPDMTTEDEELARITEELSRPVDR